MIEKGKGPVIEKLCII